MSAPAQGGAASAAAPQGNPFRDGTAKSTLFSP
jgi:hypothetical protein